jgi:hypothetical protein
VNGFEEALTNPVEAAVGAAEPQGKAKTSQAVATVELGFMGWVQLKIAEFDVTVAFVKVVGLLHVGAGAQVTLLAQPVDVVVPFEVNTNVKHPVDAEDVNEGGKAVPVKVANNGAEASLPSYTFNKSEPF